MTAARQRLPEGQEPAATALATRSPADHSGETRRSTRNGAVGLAGAAVNGVCGFVLTTVVVRSLGATGSGAMFTVIGVVSIVAAVCCLGADTGLLWAAPRRRLGRTGDAGGLLVVALLPTLAVATLVAAAGLPAAGPIAHTLLDATNPDGPTLVRLALLGVPVIVAATVLLAAVRAARPVGAYVGVQFVGVPVARPILLGLAVSLGGGVTWAFAGWLAPVAAAAAIALALAVGPFGLGAGAALRPAAGQWRAFWAFALPRAASVAVDASSMWVGVLLTGALAGQAEAGVFGAVGRYVLAGTLVMQGLRVAVAPQLSRLLGSGQRGAAAAVYRRTTLAIVLLSWPAYLLLAVFAPAFLRLFGSQFAAGAAPMAVLALAMMVNVGVGLVQTVLLMSGNSRGHLLATVLGLTLNLVAAVALIPRHGALGAAIAWSIGVVAENVLAASLARRVLGEPLSAGAPRGAALAAVAVAALASAIGVGVGGRGLPGLAVALAALALAAGGSLVSGPARAALTNLLHQLRTQEAPS